MKSSEIYTVKCLIMTVFVARKNDKRRDRNSLNLSDEKLNRKTNRRSHRCFIYEKLHRMRNCKFFDDVRIYVFKLIVKKRDTKTIDDKYNKRSKKHREYTANAETNIENTDLKENYVEKTVALFKNAVSKIFKFK